MPQHLSTGTPMAEKYASTLGFTGVTMRPLPTQMLMCLVGRSGEGKSYFWQSCPDALILNLDGSSTSYADLKARLLPGIRRDGQPVVPDPDAPLLPNGLPDPEHGVAFDMDWKWMLQVQQQLIEIAANEYKNRPGMVVIDTADTAYSLLKPWMIADWNERYVKSMLDTPKEKFKELGFDAWPESYTYLFDYGIKLRRAGYGVCYVFHLDDKLVHLNEKTKEWFRDVPRVPDNCYQAIKGRAELLLRIELCEEDKIERFEKKDSKGKVKINATTGKPMVATRVVGKERRAILRADATRAPRIAKQRVNLPDKIILPIENPYAEFERVYLEAAGLNKED